MMAHFSLAPTYIHIYTCTQPAKVYIKNYALLLATTHTYTYILHTLLMISWQMSLCTLVSHSLVRSLSSVTQPVSDACNATKLMICATTRGIVGVKLVYLHYAKAERLIHILTVK